MRSFPLVGLFLPLAGIFPMSLLTERLEKLFELYTQMTTAAKAKPALKTTKGKAK